MTDLPHFFTGKERIEPCEELGGALARMGTFDELKVSDFQKMQEEIKGKNEESIKLRLEYIHHHYTPVAATFFEWALALPNATYNLLGEEKEKNITQHALTIWFKGVSSSNEFANTRALNDAIRFFNKEFLTVRAVEELREKMSQKLPHSQDEFMQMVQDNYDAMLEALTKKDYGLLSTLFTKYFFDLRGRHDLMGEFVTSYTGQVRKFEGQDKGVEVMGTAFNSCSFIEGLVSALNALGGNPALLTHFLWSHLCAHFSGPNREGSVMVEETDENFVIKMNPCGTGGAIRARNLAGTSEIEESAPYTWGLKKSVCDYCAHCAMNEIHTFAASKTLLWLTNFQVGNPNKCEWVVPKDKKYVPQERIEIISK